MLKCEVEACGVTERELPEGCRFVSYPDDNRLPVWIEITKGKGSSWSPQSHTRICSQHFELRYFYGNKRDGRLLKGAMPSLSLSASQLAQESATVPSTSTSPQPSLPFSPIWNEGLCAVPIRNNGAASSVSIRSNGALSSAPVRSNGVLSSAPIKNNGALSSPSTRSNGAPSSAPIRTNGALSSAPTKSVEVPEHLASARKSRSKPTTSDATAILDYLNVEEDDHLNKILLKKSIRGLIFHVDYLCEQSKTNRLREVELRSMRYILLKVQKNLGISADEALEVFQNKIPDKIYTTFRRFVKVERKQMKALIRSFSLSLHFYSQPAYSFLRHKLRGAIPHPRTVQAWYTTIDKYMV